MARLKEIAIRAAVPFALALLGVLACGGQLTPSQTGTGGSPGSGGSNGTGGRGAGGGLAAGGTAGACPGPGTDGSVVICAQDCLSDVALPPVCAGNGWTCPAGTLDVRTCFSRCAVAQPLGCSCNPMTGVVTCADAGSSCADGGQSGLICAGGCLEDVAFPAVCAGGVWTCPSGTVDVKTCANICTPPPPPGCTCDPNTGALTCRRDGGADAAPPPG
jgi:hypothetical protein